MLSQYKIVVVWSVMCEFHRNLYFRMAQSEDVQYFQFDSEGNMYIYEGGAGCTGIPRKVAPGEELHLSNGVNITDTQVETFDSLNVVEPKLEIFTGNSSQADR